MNSRDQYRDQEGPPGDILSEEHLLQEALAWTAEVPVSPALTQRILEIPQHYPLFPTDTPWPRQQVLATMRRLLQGHACAPGRSILVQEAHLGVVVNMRETERPALGDITLMVYGRDEWAAEVAQIPVTLTGYTVEGEERQWMGQTNLHGVVHFSQCALGTYCVRIPESVGRSGDRVYGERLPPALAAQSAGQRARYSRELPQVWATTDATVSATVISAPDGVIDVAVETHQEQYADATVRCAFVSPTGHVAYSTVVSLTPVPDSAQLWEGRVQLHLETDEPCEFVFEVLPAAEAGDV